MKENQELEIEPTPGYYAIIEAPVLFDPGLGAIEKLLYGLITVHTQAEGYCWATNAYFGRLLGRNATMISRYLSNLQTQGHIKIKHVIEPSKTESETKKIPLRTRRYIWVDWSGKTGGVMKNHKGVKKGEGLMKNHKGGLMKNHKHNNININNIKNRIINNSIKGFSGEKPLASPSSGIVFKRTTRPVKSIASRLREKLKKQPHQTKSTQPTKKRRYSLIEYWNIFPNTPHHKNPDTKIYKHTARQFRLLLSGGFGKNKVWNKEWSKRNSIPKNFFNGKKWTEKELQEGLRRLSLHYVEGYWPQDKSHLPHSLKDLIYNPRTHTSWLLRALVKSPGKIKVKNKKPDWLYKDEDYYEADGSVKKEYRSDKTLVFEVERH